ncbi:DoxX family protein [Kribbella caucasensis]|nr:DoxX family protein [Kribbella sp. VKM Ac-2527]
MPLVVLLGALGIAKVLAVPAMRAAAAHAHLSVTVYRTIGATELAAVAGLLIGFWWHPAGASAAVGVVLLMVGAITVHVRNHDAFLRWLPAIGTAALAVAYVVLLAGGWT